MVTGVVSPPPPVLAFNFYRAWGSGIPLLVHRVLLLTHALALSASFAIEKISTNLYEYALRGIRTHENDLYQTRG